MSIDTDRVIQVVEDLMKSHDELMAGIGHIVVDYALLNQCRIDGDALLRELKENRT
jgi:hypothetical protein